MPRFLPFACFVSKYVPKGDHERAQAHAAYDVRNDGIGPYAVFYCELRRSIAANQP